MFEEHYTGKVCIVTGGAGFIGSALVEELIAYGAIVRIIDNLSVGQQNVEYVTTLGATLFKEDICDYKKIEPIFKDTDYVFHLAAMNRAQRSIDNPLLSNKINIEGTLNCLHLSHLNNIDKFIFVSSSSVYKGVKEGTLNEAMHLEPLHPYGVGKLAGEHYCRIYNNLFNLKTTVLRYFSVYGPRQRGDIEYAGVIAKFFNQARNNKDITVYGNGTQKRNFSMVLDVVKGTLLAAVNRKAVGEIINIASKKEFTVNEIAEIIIKITKSSSRVVNLKPIKGDPKNNKADTTKAKKILGFKCDYDLIKGLEYINQKSL